MASHMTSAHYLVSAVGLRKLPIMGFLGKVSKSAEGELSALSGHLHRETRGDAISALAIHQGKALEVAGSKRRGHLGATEEHSQTGPRK